MAVPRGALLSSFLQLSCCSLIIFYKRKDYSSFWLVGNEKKGMCQGITCPSPPTFSFLPFLFTYFFDTFLLFQHQRNGVFGQPVYPLFVDFDQILIIFWLRYSIFFKHALTLFRMFFLLDISERHSDNDLT